MDVWLDCDLKNKANIMTDPICLHHLAKKNVGSWNSYKKFAMRKYLERFFAFFTERDREGTSVEGDLYLQVSVPISTGINSFLPIYRVSYYLVRMRVHALFFATSYASSCLFLKEQINKHPFKNNGFVIGGTKFPFAEKNRRMGTDLGIRYFIS